MKPATPIVLSQNDYQRLLILARNIRTGTADALEEEITRASVVSEPDLPEGIVTMNSTVRFVDEATGGESVVTLVYPQDADIDEGKVSILAPVGIALIGLRVGQSIRWPMPSGKERELRVVSVAKARIVA